MCVLSFLSINILDVTGIAQNVIEIDGVIQTGHSFWPLVLAN